MPAAGAPLAALLARVHATMGAAGLEYVVVGRAAAQLWGAQGAVLEVAVVARMRPGDVEDLQAAAQARGLGVDPGLAALAAEEGAHLTLFTGTDAYVDVRPSRGQGDASALHTRVHVDMGGGQAVWVASLEECVARLLDEGSPEALDAARQLLALHGPRVDRVRLGQRCEDLGVLRLLREVDPRGAPPRAA